MSFAGWLPCHLMRARSSAHQGVLEIDGSSLEYPIVVLVDRLTGQIVFANLLKKE